MRNSIEGWDTEKTEELYSDGTVDAATTAKKSQPGAGLRHNCVLLAPPPDAHWLPAPTPDPQPLAYWSRQAGAGCGNKGLERTRSLLLRWAKKGGARGGLPDEGAVMAAARRQRRLRRSARPALNEQG